MSTEKKPGVDFLVLLLLRKCHSVLVKQSYCCSHATLSQQLRSQLLLKGSQQQLIHGFVTTKEKLIGNGILFKTSF